MGLPNPKQARAECVAFKRCPKFDASTLYDKNLTHATDVKQHLELHSLKTFMFDLNFFEVYATWKRNRRKNINLKIKWQEAIEKQ